jgi:hypothetical protein
VFSNSTIVCSVIIAPPCLFFIMSAVVVEAAPAGANPRSCFCYFITHCFSCCMSQKSQAREGAAADERMNQQKNEEMADAKSTKNQLKRLLQCWNCCS